LGAAEADSALDLGDSHSLLAELPDASVALGSELHYPLGDVKSFAGVAFYPSLGIGLANHLDQPGGGLAWEVDFMASKAPTQQHGGFPSEDFAQFS
jgi:hypothetical protein